MAGWASRHPVARWSVPGVAAAALIAGGQVAMHHSASASPNLPDRSAQQVLTDLLSAHPAGFSGTVRTSVDLGLPNLPDQASSGASPMSLLTAPQTLRVWYAGPHQARIALLGNGSETDLISNGADTWLWRSATQEAWHLQRMPDVHRMTPDHRKRPGPGDLAPSMTPKGMASMALAMLKPTTDVSSGQPVSIAGRSAYQVTFTPKDTHTTIGSVRIAVDARTHVPLRTQVFAKDSDHPAINVGFTDISFEVPPDSRFEFTPPPDATVHSLRHEAHSSTPPSRYDGKRAPGPQNARVVGSGWSSVLVTSATTDAVGPGSKSSAVPQEMLQMLPRVHGSWGSGHLLKSTLFSAVVTDDGRIAVGAVSPGQLYAALKRG